MFDNEVTIVIAVSYTHLDVYKRQPLYLLVGVFVLQYLMYLAYFSEYNVATCTIIAPKMFFTKKIIHFQELTVLVLKKLENRHHKLHQ